MKLSTLCILAAVSTLGAVAPAETISVSANGGLSLQSGDLSATVFNGTRPAWSHTSLASVHTALNASGIDTSGKVTFVPAETDQGLSLLVLIDHDLGGAGSGTLGHLHMASSISGGAATYVDSIEDSVTMAAGSGPTRTASADFAWYSDGGGDGFAWTHLQAGSNMSFRFARPTSGSLGLIDPNTFQFVTWNGQGWQVAQLNGTASFAASGDFDFTSTLIALPLPATAAMGLPLLGLPLIRRRRRA